MFHLMPGNIRENWNNWIFNRNFYIFLLSKILNLVKFGCFNTANRWMLSIDLISNHGHDSATSTFCITAGCLQPLCESGFQL